MTQTVCSHPNCYIVTDADVSSPWCMRTFLNDVDTMRKATKL